MVDVGHHEHKVDVQVKIVRHKDPSGLSVGFSGAVFDLDRDDVSLFGSSSRTGVGNRYTLTEIEVATVVLWEVTRHRFYREEKIRRENRRDVFPVI